MGSGSFGGGSGSFGGGSGGGSGGGGGATGAPPARTDSAGEKILGLTTLTEAFNKNPEIARVSAMLYQMLQDRTRAAFMQTVLTDPMVDSAYKGLLSLNDELHGGTTLVTVAAEFGVSRIAVLADLAEAIALRGEAGDSDERAERIVQQAVKLLLLKTVGNRNELFYETPIANLESNFDGTPLRNTADSFLGTIIRGVTRSDVLNLSDQAKSAFGDASHQIAIAWTDKFKDRSRKKGVSFRAMLPTIAADYAEYAAGGNT
jgi:hypothetical protein